ncbi:MAG TPA: hypothetical protein VIV40_27415 [Kofleriaceae bacterium]
MTAFALTAHRPVHWLAPIALAVSLTSSACVGTPDLEDTDSELTASYKAQIKSRTLSIIGNNAASKLALRLGATTSILEVDVGDDGTAEFRFDRAKFDRISIDASGGNDIITIREQFGVFTNEQPTTIDGGSGDDTITGGFGAETIIGGAGNDTVIGRGGADTISLGAGDDTTIWDPGAGNDLVAGNDGVDTLVFNGTNIDEEIVLGANADHVRLTRNIALITLDLDTVEVVDLHMLGGADRITVDELSATPLANVNVDLQASGTSDGQSDTVIVNASSAADTIEIGADGAAVAATGLSTEVRVTNGDPGLDRLVVNGDANDRVNINGSPAADNMVVIADPSGLLYDGGAFNILVAPSAAIPVKVNGLGGDDTIATAGSVTSPLTFDGGDGNDQLRGGYADDRLLGGAGNDTVEGRLGIDTVLLGDGDDTDVWNPGDSSDVIDGGAGADALVFNASNAGETIDVRANGAHVSLFRDIGSVTLDLGAVERFDVRCRGGIDNVVVNPLTGTSATEVNVDLAASPGIPGGDAQPDVVVVNGEPTVATIDVAGEGAAVAANGLGATLRVVGGEPSLDRLVVHGRVLNVNGSPAADTMTIMADASGPLYDGGNFNTLVAPSGVAEVIVKGNSGDDTINTIGSVTTALTIDGGDGNDTIFGGVGADRLIGGAGNDIVEGRMGADTLLLGDGDDTFIWNPGDASDVVEGSLGSDAVIFNGSAADEMIEITPNGSRVKVLRNIAAINLDLGGIERIDLRTRGGVDSVLISDLTGTAVGKVNLELAYDGSSTADGLPDSVTIVGSAGDDAIAVTADTGALVVSGLSAAVTIAHPDVADQLQLHGAAGVDTFLIGTGAASLMTVLTYQD